MERPLGLQMFMGGGGYKHSSLFLFLWDYHGSNIIKLFSFFGTLSKYATVYVSRKPSPIFEGKAEPIRVEHLRNGPLSFLQILNHAAVDY
jgi:hypothetical protein